MEKNRLLIALGVLVALVVATYLAYRKPPEDASATATTPWHAIDRAQITKIIIARPNQPEVELEKRDNHWFMNRPAQGPADETAVNEALTGLSQMHVVATVATETASHDELEVDAAHGVHVQLFRAGNANALDVWVGKNLDSGTAVRTATGPRVYRVDQSVRFSISKETREWRDRQVTHIERDHVRSVDWRRNGQTWHFDRNGDTWTAAATNPAIERLDTAKVNQTVSNLLELRATDFADAGAHTGIAADGPSVVINVDNGAPVTLRAGDDAPEGQVFVQREGSDVVYRVGSSHKNEIALDPTVLQAPAPAPDGGAAAHTDASVAPAAPPGDGSIPPEVMEQIRRQLQQRGMAMPH